MLDVRIAARFGLQIFRIFSVPAGGGRGGQSESHSTIPTRYYRFNPYSAHHLFALIRLHFPAAILTAILTLGSDVVRALAGVTAPPREAVAAKGLTPSAGGAA